MHTRTKIRDALKRMENKGGVCAELADIGYQLLARDTSAIRVFPHGTFEVEAGVGKVGGGAHGDYSWLVLSKRWLEQFHDASNPSLQQDRDGAWYWVTLQAILAHELDHLAGRGHIWAPYNPSKESRLLSPNTQACADVTM